MRAGPGLCVALEGGISAEAAVAAHDARWHYDYQSATAGVPMLRARQYDSGIWDFTTYI